MQLGAVVCSLTGLAPRALDMIFGHVRPATAPRGRPWALPLEQRVIIRPKPIASSPISSRESRRSYAQRSPPSVVDGTLVPTRDHSAAAKAKNYRWSCNAQVLVRRRDLRVIAVAAGGPGNRNDPIHYRGSAVQHLCRVHGRVLADGGYRGVPELVVPAFRGRRMVRDRRWRSHRRRRARVEHALARLKDWRVLRDYRRRGAHLLQSLQAIAVLHNIRIELRNNS